MQRTLILDCNEKNGQEVTICGWVQTRRDHGKILFLDIVDRSAVIQVVVLNPTEAGAAELRPQDVISVSGKVNQRPERLVNANLATGKVELLVDKVMVLSKAAELPFDMGMKDLDLQLPTLLDYRTLTLRHPKVRDIFKVQAKLVEGFRKTALELDCVEVFVPTISASSTEGGAEVFKVKYYEHEAFLTQSPQLYKQMMVGAFERVFLLSHAYRSEPSVTTRHLSESTQMDCELGFVEFEELLDAVELVGRETLQYAVTAFAQVLAEFGVEAPKLTKDVPRLTLREAQKLILERTGRDNTEELDLTPEDEKELCKWANEERGSDLVTITHFPTQKRAFYSAPDPKDPEFSLSFDLLFKGVEILSGSKRIDNYDQLVDVIRERGMDPENFEMYLQSFKYGMPPHGGFSFGLERLTMLLLGLSNIREASLFPRDMERVDFRLSSKK